MDIFDKIMLWPFLRRFNSIYKKYKEPLLYIFFGGLTTVISIGVFAFFSYVVYLDEITANTISWICAVLFAYVTNRIWVFHSAAAGLASIIREMIAFFGGRLLTLLFETSMMLVFVTFLHQNKMLVKIIATIFVMVLNYIISKVYIFREAKREEP